MCVAKDEIRMHLLSQQKKRLSNLYHLYQKKCISKKEYCRRVKPIDQAIDKLEMSTLQGTLVWQEAFSLHVQKPRHQEAFAYTL